MLNNTANKLITQAEKMGGIIWFIINMPDNQRPDEKYEAVFEFGALDLEFV